MGFIKVANLEAKVESRMHRLELDSVEINFCILDST